MRNAKIAAIFLGLKLTELFLLFPIGVLLYIQIMLLDDIASIVLYTIISFFVIVISIIETITETVLHYRDNPVKYLFNIFRIFFILEGIIWISTTLAYLLWASCFGIITFVNSNHEIIEAGPIIYFLIAIVVAAILGAIYLSLYPIIEHNWNVAKQILDNHEKKNYISTEENKEVDNNDKQN